MIFSRFHSTRDNKDIEIQSAYTEHEKYLEFTSEIILHRNWEKTFDMEWVELEGEVIIKKDTWWWHIWVYLKTGKSVLGKHQNWIDKRYDEFLNYNWELCKID